MSRKEIKPMLADYSQWYLDVALEGKLFEYSPTAGCITFLPKSVDIWEKIRAAIDMRLKQVGVKNILLPSLIPMDMLSLEKEFVAGFSPELAVVTHGGGKVLERPLAMRPTSEMLFCDFFQRALKTYKDLPLLYNQWCNVLRWEKRTRPFLRTMEFHWQEGHTLHETQEEAFVFAQQIMSDVYLPVINEVLAIAGVYGKKPPSERFAGALETLTYEPMMSNGWALQICTSHLLGEGFVRSFNIQFVDQLGALKTPSYTSWGLSTRTIGGLISSHSDDKGLVIPPKLSEYVAVLVPVFGSHKAEIQQYLLAILLELGFVVDDKLLQTAKSYLELRHPQSQQAILIDYRDLRLGEKLYDFERSGYPLALVFGANEQTKQQVLLYSRVQDNKQTVSLAGLMAFINQISERDQQSLYLKSLNRLKSRISICETFEQIRMAIEQGNFVLFNWDMKADANFEAKLKEELSATIRCIPDKSSFVSELISNKPNHEVVLIARNF